MYLPVCTALHFMITEITLFQMQQNPTEGNDWTENTWGTGAKRPGSAIHCMAVSDTLSEPDSCVKQRHVLLIIVVLSETCTLM